MHLSRHAGGFKDAFKQNDQFKMFVEKRSGGHVVKRRMFVNFVTKQEWPNEENPISTLKVNKKTERQTNVLGTSMIEWSNIL